jgi:hypothetical protein
MFVSSTCVQVWVPLPEQFEFIVGKDSTNTKASFCIQVDDFLEGLLYGFDLAVQQGFYCSEFKATSDGDKNGTLFTKVMSIAMVTSR